MQIAHVCRLIAKPGYRSEWLLKCAKPENLFTPVGCTWFDRHPAIFVFVRDQLSHIAVPRILSYGCSTGEEVFTLRRYFPKAEIVGIDINPRSIAVCNRKLAKDGDPHVRFELAGSPKRLPEASFDAIFCMSVLRHPELGALKPSLCSQQIRFADFDKTVAGMNLCLKPGGYLIIDGSNFRFSDTVSASGFNAVYSVDASKPRADTPIYGADNKWLQNTVYNDVIFLKRKILDEDR